MKFIVACLVFIVSFNHVRIRATPLGSYLYDDLVNNQSRSSAAEHNSDDNIQKIMEILKGSLTAAADQTMAKLDSMLLLQGHPQVSKRLRSKISGFTNVLSVHLESDLSNAVSEYKSLHGSDPFADEDYYYFSQIILKKWEETLSSDLVAFQESILPRFVNSIHKIWHGLEKKVISNIEKFKNILYTRLPHFSDTCSIKKPILTGYDHVKSVNRGYSEMAKRSVIVYLAEVALIVAAVIGVIALATAGPLLLLFVALWVFKDHLAYRIHGPI